MTLGILLVSAGAVMFLCVVVLRGAHRRWPKEVGSSAPAAGGEPSRFTW